MSDPANTETCKNNAVYVIIMKLIGAKLLLIGLKVKSMLNGRKTEEAPIQAIIKCMRISLFITILTVSIICFAEQGQRVLV